MDLPPIEKTPQRSASFSEGNSNVLDADAIANARKTFQQLRHCHVQSSQVHRNKYALADTPEDNVEDSVSKISSKKKRGTVIKAIKRLGEVQGESESANDPSNTETKPARKRSFFGLKKTASYMVRKKIKAFRNLQSFHHL